MADEYIKLVTNKEIELSELYTRMDNDRELVNLKSYVMKSENNKEISDVVNVTLNKPAIFAANVESALNNAIEQVSIVTEDNNVDRDHIADCVRAGFASANGRLRAQGKWPLNKFIDQQMCQRGGGAARVLFRMVEVTDAKGKKRRLLKPDISEWDRRYFTCETGEDGLSWAAYHTNRTKTDILAEYPDTKVDKDNAEIVDFWNSEVNAVYADGKQILEQANPYGYPPVCTQLVTLGSMLADSDNIKYQGESIFFLIRDCIPELNRIISIMQTLNMIAIKGPGGWGSKGGDKPVPEYDEIMKRGSVTQEEIGGGWRKYDFGDVKNAAIYALNVIDNAIKQGSLEVIDVGTLPGPLSAVALIEIGEGRDQIFLPRLAARGMLNQQIADMMLSQIIATGESNFDMGTKGRQRTFDLNKLKGAYDVEFNYFVRSPKIDIARYSVAQIAAQFLDEESIVKDVLQLEDPDGVIRRRHYDMAAKLSPLVLTRRIIRSLSEMEDDDAAIDAELLAAEMNMTVEKVMTGEMTTLKQPETPVVPAESLVPLMANMERPNSANKAAQLKAMPRESEGE